MLLKIAIYQVFQSIYMLPCWWAFECNEYNHTEVQNIDTVPIILMYKVLGRYDYTTIYL